MKAIIFDLGGVYFHCEIDKIIEKISSELNLEKEKVREVLYGKLGTEYRISKINRDEFWQKAKEVWGDVDTDKAEEMWLNSYTKDEKTAAIVDKLNELGYGVYYLSDNVPERVAYLSKKYDFIKNFKDGVFSHIVKVRKPDLRIYEILLEKVNEIPENCIFIDDKERFLVPAKELGMDVIHFQNAEQLEKELQRILNITSNLI